MTVDPDMLVIRPSAQTYKRNRVGGPSMVVLVGGVAAQMAHLGVWGVVVGLAALAIALAIAYRYVTGLRVEVDFTTLRYRGLLRTRAWSLSDVASALMVKDLRVTNLQPSGTWLIPRRADGRRLFQITSGVWSPASIARLADRLAGVTQVERLREPLMLADLHRRHPGAFHPAQAHPIVAGLSAAVLVTAVVLAATYLIVGADGS